MSLNGLTAGRRLIICGVIAAGLFCNCETGQAADEFPFDRELLLVAAPMRPGKRIPSITVENSGTAWLDLWCKSITVHVEIGEGTIKIDAGPLPDELPTMQSAGQCTPERIQADQDLLAVFVQASG